MIRLLPLMLLGCLGDWGVKDDSTADSADPECYEVTGECPDTCYDVASDAAYFRAIWQCGAPNDDPTDPAADCAPAVERLWGYSDGTAQLCAYCTDLEGDVTTASSAYTFIKGTICDPEPTAGPASLAFRPAEGAP